MVSIWGYEILIINFELSIVLYLGVIGSGLKECLDNKDELFLPFSKILFFFSLTVFFSISILSLKWIKKLKWIKIY